MRKNRDNLTLEDSLKEGAAENRRNEKLGKWKRYLPFIGIVCTVIGVVIGLVPYFKG